MRGRHIGPIPAARAGTRDLPDASRSPGGHAAGVAIFFWKVLDSPVVDACLGPAAVLFVLTVAAVLLPEGSGLEAAAEFFAFVSTIALVWELFAALLGRRG